VLIPLNLGETADRAGHRAPYLRTAVSRGWFG
jgi:hypothetical protein